MPFFSDTQGLIKRIRTFIINFSFIYLETGNVRHLTWTTDNILSDKKTEIRHQKLSLALLSEPNIIQHLFSKNQRSYMFNSLFDLLIFKQELLL